MYHLVFSHCVCTILSNYWLDEIYLHHVIIHCPFVPSIYFFFHFLVSCLLLNCLNFFRVLLSIWLYLFVFLFVLMVTPGTMIYINLICNRLSCWIKKKTKLYPVYKKPTLHTKEGNTLLHLPRCLLFPLLLLQH